LQCNSPTQKSEDGTLRIDYGMFHDVEPLAKSEALDP
jgi:hypothetical protein